MSPITGNSSVADIPLSYRMWEGLSFRKPQFLPGQELVILMRGVITRDCYCVVQADKGNTHLSDASLLQPVQISMKSPRDSIRLQ